MNTKTYTPRADSGSLRASQSKRTQNSPDYWGDIAIDLRNTTGLRVDPETGLTIIKLSGWKKTLQGGGTFLSLAVDRFVPQAQQVAAPQQPQRQPGADDGDDIPFLFNMNVTHDSTGQSKAAYRVKHGPKTMRLGNEPTEY